MFRDVYAFTERLKDLACSRSNGDAVVTSLITLCLNGRALGWHAVELPEHKRIQLRHASLEEWCTTLINRFKIPTSDALKYLMSHTYSIHDVRDLPPRDWVIHMLCYAKAAGIMPTHKQLWMIWNRLDVDIRWNITEPSEATSP